MKWYTLQEIKSPETGARLVLRSLLRENEVRALLVNTRLGGGRLGPSLVASESAVEACVVFFPFQLVSGAGLLAKLTSSDPGGRLGAVLKPCEQRAFVELVKFRQADHAHVLTITTDCLGTVEADDSSAARLLDSGARGIQTAAAAVRPVCSICTDFAIEGDLHLGFLGADRAVFVGVNEDLDEETGERINRVLETLGARTTTREELKARKAALEQEEKTRRQAREARFARLGEELKDMLSFGERFLTCRLCFNCRRACPICYCRECLFEGPTFEPEAGRFVRWAEKRGLLPLPAEVALFHLTRMTHMVLSCVGCGQCTSACPNDLPVAELFSAFGEKARALFNYRPGMSYYDPPPLTTFEEEELHFVSEPTGR